MSHSTWMIYGATGTTGTLIAEEAVRRGHQPVLAGRSAITRHSGKTSRPPLEGREP